MQRIRCEFWPMLSLGRKPLTMHQSSSLQTSSKTIKYRFPSAATSLTLPSSRCPSSLATSLRIFASLSSRKYISLLTGQRPRSKHITRSSLTLRRYYTALKQDWFCISRPCLRPRIATASALLLARTPSPRLHQPCLNQPYGRRQAPRPARRRCGAGGRPPRYAYALGLSAFQ